MGNSICCGGSGNKARPGANDGSVLDRVISQASGEDDCLLYRLANYKNGGELIDAYQTGGQTEVERVIKEQFGVLMYADGRGQIINRAEYLLWKFRDHKQVVLPIEASLSPHDPLAKWEDHEACWQMQYRGSLGETLLHVLIICDTKLHTRLARTLLKCFPKLALDVVEGEEYLGASALHLAIAYANNELVQDLVDAGANTMQRAIGSFFLPRDQQLVRPKRQTDYEGLAYLGEYPLSWAACCANEGVYNLLIDVGANPDAQDSFGNMILHMVVVCDKLDMFGYALRHPRLPASNGVMNKAGLSPLALACKLGRAEVFREMLELSCREFWRYSNITCSAYPLNALDTLQPDGRTNWNSALFIILNGTKEEHLDMLDGGIIQRLLEEKWKTFARQQFLKRLIVLFVHLLTLSMAVYMRPTERTEPLIGMWDASHIIRFCFELGTLASIFAYLFLQQGGEIKNQGLWSYFKQLGHAPAKAIFLVSNLMILACIPFRFNGDRNTEEAILVFAVPGNWFLLMFFAGAVRLTGPFVTMVYSMITGDMLTFGIIYTVVLFGFSQSFYFLYKGFPGVKSSPYHSYASTWMALFQTTMGDYNYPDLSNTTYPALSKTVFAMFMVLVPILLLNMLIAMMGNTYAHVIEQSEKEFMKQWAKIVVTLERAVNQSDAHHYLQEYSITLGQADDTGAEQRGVMVIKSKSKTRAKQRKGAVANWKRVGKVTIRELKKRGMTGEQLRRLMWGRASISTPTRMPKTTTFIDHLVPGGMDDDNDEVPDKGFGFALTAALDMMAFENDLELPQNGLPPQAAVPPPAPANAVNATNNSAKAANSATKPANPAVKPPAQAVPPNPVVNVPAAASKTAAGVTASAVATPAPGATTLSSATSTIGSVPVPVAPSVGVRVPEDPLRELVLRAESATTPPNELTELARRAANTDHLEEVTREELKPPQLSPLTNHLSVIRAPSIASLERSDSDGLGKDGPLLGSGSRHRRIRSARFGRSRDDSCFGRHLLDDAASTTSDASSFDLGVVNFAFVGDEGINPVPPDLDGGIVATHRLAHPEDIPTTTYRSPTPTPSPPPTPRPAKDSVRTNRRSASTPSPTTPKTTTVLPPRPKAAPPTPPLRSSASAPAPETSSGPGRSLDPDGSPSEPRTKKSGHKHKRPRTVRDNRVVPAQQGEAMPRSASASAGMGTPRSSRRCKGGAHTGSSSGTSGGSEATSSPDPLEPWSTRGITSMNKLLAWDRSDHDSL